MRININYADLLKAPFGILIKEKEIDETKVNQFVERANKIITVGDTTTDRLVGFGHIPDLSVIDNREKRVIKSKTTEFQVDEKMYCENKPGEINADVISLIREITSANFYNKIQIIVKGEEDLVALPLFMYSPDKWTVFYGQPNEGLVVVEVNDTVRERARLIFNKVFTQ
ncbi:MAG: GTP-dependent dephospho-CoA kinase family protein [Thermoproteota archaeon]|nr:GTP-dependent dephospho-CoA kinase family protein [Thermoproteota archaeon]